MKRRHARTVAQVTPYVRDFQGQARRFAARAHEAQKRGDRQAALYWARQAKRALKNMETIRTAVRVSQPTHWANNERRKA